MKIEVDQSGKIERSNHDTIIAASNDKQYCVKIPRKVKRNILDCRKEIKQIKYKLFCIGVYFCIKRYLHGNNLIIIDDEYHGKNKLIKSILFSYIRTKNKEFNNDLIRFDTIGKNSNAHHIVIETFRKEHQPNEILNEKEIWGLLK